MSDEAERVVQEAVWLFRAFCSGVASSDVRDRKMTKEQADAWRTEAVADFEKMLREPRP